MSIAVELEMGRWIKAVVEAETDLTAWLDIIPEGADLPACRFQAQSRLDLVAVDRNIIMTRTQFLVVCSVQGADMNALVGYAEDIHAALHRQNGSTEKATILSCARVAPFMMTDVQGVDIFRHAGGMYDVYAQES